MTFKQRVNDFKYTWEIYQRKHPVLAIVDIAIAVCALIAIIIII